MNKKKVVIIGGGFGGIRTVLDLAKNKNFEVVLISNNRNFEYYPGLHKLVGVSHHATASVPLEKILSGKAIEFIFGAVNSIDSDKKIITVGSQTITADYIIVAVGSQTEYFNISGLREMSYGLKSVAEAIALRNHIEEMFQKHAHTEKTESVVGLHMVVVGAGPNGTDLAGELAVLSKQLAKKYNVTETLVTIDLVEGAPRVLPMLSERVSTRVQKRLQNLGVEVLCNRDLRKEDGWTVEFVDMKIGAKTLVWTAGITTNELVKNISGLVLGKKNRVAVDEYLQPKKSDGASIANVFVIGDVADTSFSGLAQTALYDASFVSKNISKNVKGSVMKKYIPHPNAFNIGVGPRWSVLVIGKFTSFGLFAYVMRTLIDIKFFLSILPVGEVWKLYFDNKVKN